MKNVLKKIAFFAILLLIAITAVHTAFAAPAVTVSVNDCIIDLNPYPVTYGQHILLPASQVFTAMGMNCEWNSETGELLVSGEEHLVEIKLNENIAFSNGIPVIMDTEAVMVSSCLVIPYTAIEPLVGWNVYYDTKYSKRISISMPLGTKIEQSIEDFENSLFDERLLDWSINCYDPESGGFYRSQSAKETEGFLPDREASVKHIEIISQMVNVSSDELVNSFSFDMKDRLKSFAKDSQSSRDGNWYEPPWTIYANESKILYGNSGAMQLLAMLDEKPLYPTPAEWLEESLNPTLNVEFVSVKILPDGSIRQETVNSVAPGLMAAKVTVPKAFGDGEKSARLFFVVYSGDTPKKLSGIAVADIPFEQRGCVIQTEALEVKENDILKLFFWESDIPVPYKNSVSLSNN